MLRILVALLLLPFTQARAQTPGPSDIQEGKRIWQGYFGLENDCKLCHGEHGEGGFAKALAGHQLSTAQFLRTVRQGAGKTMPAFVADKNLSDQQLSQVAAYLASLPKPPEAASQWRTPVPPLATPRQKLYVESGCDIARLVDFSGSPDVSSAAHLHAMVDGEAAVHELIGHHSDRTSFPIDFAVAGERQRRHLDEHRRRHVVRHLLEQKGPQFARVWGR